ncbi:MAG: LLM class flavin-dependent oxidoreductase [Saprospiraceae bacterium]|nr:LLM class flavin-dependent oxidoreductase [Saprospiraceae bacterium]
MAEMKLGILDFGGIKPRTVNSHNVINSVLGDIQTYEELGFHRYWLAEHYSYEYAWFSPEMLLPLLAGYSSKINIGWAGVLLHIHSPLNIANNMRILSALYDGRIDVGLARAQASEEYLKMLRVEKTKWIPRLREFIELCNGTWTDDETNELLFVPPHATPSPRMWYLANSNKTIQLAVQHKMNYAISLMHPGSNYSNNLDTLKQYKEAYFKEHNELPTTSLLVCVANATDRRKIDVFNSRFKTPGLKNLFGSANYIADRLHEMKETFSNDEFVLFMPICQRELRLQNYRQIIQSV